MMEMSDSDLWYMILRLGRNFARNQSPLTVDPTTIAFTVEDICAGLPGIDPPRIAKTLGNHRYKENIIGSGPFNLTRRGVSQGIELSDLGEEIFFHLRPQGGDVEVLVEIYDGATMGQPEGQFQNPAELKNYFQKNRERILSELYNYSNGKIQIRTLERSVNGEVFFGGYLDAVIALDDSTGGDASDLQWFRIDGSPYLPKY